MTPTLAGCFPSPADESAWRLGSADYGLWEVVRKLSSGGYSYSFALVKKQGGVWHLVKRLGSTGGDGGLRAAFHHLDLRLVARLRRAFPPVLPPERTPEREAAAKAKAAADRLAGTERALRNWRRKLALAETKIKQYERRLRALTRTQEARA
jgi:hypothetical protein